LWLGALNKWREEVRVQTFATEDEVSQDESSETKKLKDKDKVVTTHVTSEKGKTKIGLDDFQMKKVIGRGRYGKIVLVVKRDTGKVYAMKIIRKSKLEDDKKHIFSERDALIKLDNPFLAKLHFTFQTPSRLYLVMEYYAGGELFWHMQKGNFSEDRARFYAAQIISVLQYMHSNDIMYRDLKPENVLLSNEGNIVLIDFGGAKEGGVAETVSTFAPEYYAPEIIRGNTYTTAVDWWSLGILIFDMMTGNPPFYTEDHEKMFDFIEKQELCIPSSFSPEVTDLLKNLLNKNPEHRLKWTVSIRKHPWFASIDWDKLEARKLRPPFIPNVSSPGDVTNIDEAFLAEDVDDSDDGEEDEENFNSWTYVNEKHT